MEIIREAKQLWTALTRIHETNDAIMFKNHTDEFTIMIRNDPNSIGYFMKIEVLIILDDDDVVINNILKNYPDAIGFDPERPGEFVLDTMEFDKRKEDLDAVESLRTFINEVFNHMTCNCRKYFIKDGKDMCIFCEMTATDEDLEVTKCPICLDTCYNMHSKTMKCCGNKLHVKCDDTWYSTGNKKCVICRAELEPRTDLPRMLNIEDIVSNIAQEVERRIQTQPSME